MAGWLPLFAAPDRAGPSTATLSITSSAINPTPTFTADGDFLDGDVIQFERQASGGDWSSATISTHTVTAGEVTGAEIDLSLDPLGNGNYEARVKYHRTGSAVWSEYSNVASFTIAVPSASYTFIASADADGAGGSGNLDGGICDYTITVPAGPSDRQLLIGVTLQGGTANFGTCSFDPDGADISVSGPISDAVRAAGQCAAFYMLPVGVASGSKVIRINFPNSSFFFRSISVWSLSGLNSTTPKQICSDDSSGASTTDTPITADAGDLLFVISPNTSAVTYSSSTESPARQDHVSGTLQNSADWQIQLDYPTDSFHLLSDGNAATKLAVTFQ